MTFDDRSVHFCDNINWYAKALTDPATVARFIAAAATALDRVKETLERH